MAIELEKIQFKDGRENPVKAEQFNKMQDNIETALNALDANRQETLIAGENITIENGVISATDTKYTAGENITIENGVISSTGGGTGGGSASEVLWENPNPTATFEPQTVQLKNNTYDYFRVIYRSGTRYYCVDFKPNTDFSIQVLGFYTPQQ